MVQRLQNAVGRVVRGANFFARKKEAGRIWRRLGSDNLLLLAPRRVGKTSMLHHLEDHAESEGFVAVYTSVAHARDEVDFVRRLVEAAASVPETDDLFAALSRGPLGQLFKRTRSVGLATLSWTVDPETPGGEWAELGRVLTEGLGRWVAGDRRFLFLIDEVPLFVLTLLRADPSAARARDFLNWFRRLRQGGEDIDFVRWVAAGSIGLDTVTARLGLGDTINDFNLVSLGAFADDEADAFLVALGDSYGIALGDAVRAHILDRVGWLIPFYLQLFFAQLMDLSDEIDGPITCAHIDAVYDALLEPANRAHFDYWRQRLDEELGPEMASQATALLNLCCHDSAGPTHAKMRTVLSRLIEDADLRDKRLRFLVDVLLTDGYLVERDGRFPFRSGLLADFWKRRVAPS